MRKLLNKIKQYRLPKETLHLIKLLNDKKKHHNFYDDVLVRGTDTYHLLFIITEKENKIQCYAHNINGYLKNTFSLFGNDEINNLENIIDEAIKNSTYSEYERIII